MTPSRNDPCPCGSGKKYKHCCLGREEARPSGTADELRRELGGRSFSSIEEAQAFANQLAMRRNRAPLDQFCGLSPEQMYRLLYFPFESPAVADFPARLEATPAAPILTLFALLVDAIGEQGLKATAKGNLPQKFCRAAALKFLGEEGYQALPRFGSVNKEEDFYELHCTRLVAELAGLVRKYKGRFILSRECRELLAEGGLATIYPRLLRTYAVEFNWAYGDGYPDGLQLVQQAFAYTLFLLDRFGDEPRDQQFYAEHFIRAFPVALNAVAPSPYIGAEETVRACYTLRALLRFAEFFGLAEVTEIKDDRSYPRRYRIARSPLLKAAVRFHTQD